MPQEVPLFDLVVATVGRVDDLGRLLDSLEGQSYRRFRVIVVDQNDDGRLDDVLARQRFDVLHLRSPLGLSRARNVGLEQLQADVVAFPDDDCFYPSSLLDDLAARFAGRPDLDGVTGRSEDDSGRSSASWKREAAVLTDDNLWNRAISFTIFLRRAVVEQVGAFDERLGIGSSEPWSSGEEIDYLIRALRTGARVEYDPALVVRHRVGTEDSRVGLRDGASIGYLLRKHRYPFQTVVRMLVRPVGGAVVSLARRDRSRASYYAATLRGRILGLRRGRKLPK